MSRYNLIPSEDSSLEITVGWDNCLNTFFLHVIQPGLEYDPDLLVDEEESEDKFILVRGNRLNEILDLADLETMVSPYTELPSYIKEALARDASLPYQRSDFQNWMINKGLVQ